MDELLAKPDIPLLEHLHDVTKRGDEIAKHLGLDPELRARALLACALHDVGKTTESFQLYIRGERNRAYPHALASLPIILVAELQLINNFGGNSRHLLATAAVLSHHSPLTVNLYRGFQQKPDYLFDPLKALLQNLWHLLESLGLDGLSPAETWDKLAREPPSALLERMFSFGAENRSLRGLLQALPPERFAPVKSVLHLSDWLVSARRGVPIVIFLQDGATAIQDYIKQQGHTLRKFQKDAQQNYGKSLSLRAPTGTGKTEALLLWAGDTDRLIYLLPSQVTVNAMWRRLRSIYGDKRVGLAHGRADYILRKEEEEPPLDARLFGSVFAKPVTVATLDQYLLAHLHGRHWEERRVLARNSALVFDEIHSYEPYTLGMLSKALQREPPARIALASATLPPALLDLFPSLEVSVEAEESLWQRRRYKLELQDEPLLNALHQIITEAQQGRNVLVVSNTVVQAQDIYRRIGNLLKKRKGRWSKLRLLHSRFAFRDRQRKEEQVMAPEPGVILVATQVVEVSLDISYDVLFTEIAPLDAIVQRMGRVNRRGEDSPVPVRVFCQWEDRSEYLYGREMLEASQDLLRTLPQYPTDRDLMEATHHLYEKIVPSETFQREWEEGRQALDEVQRVLGCYTIDLTDEEMREKFTARREHLSIDVLPKALEQKAYQLLKDNERWRIVELLVPVPVWWTIQFSDFFYMASDLQCRVCRLPYDNEVGLSPPSEHDLEEKVSGII